RVLVVDDVEKNLQLIGSLLHDRGISVVLANNGAHALQAVGKKIPDLILLDISMPEMDGYEVCEKLKSKDDTKEIPIIFLTARNEDEDIVKGFALGAVDYITKPFSKDELISRVFTHLELKKSRDIIENQNQQLEAQNRRILEHARKVEDLNEKLNSKNQELQALNSTKDKFFSIISHDLKGPLSNIKNLSEILATKIERFDQDKIVNISELLSDATNNTLKLLQDLLSWSMSQTGEISINPIQLDVNFIVKECITLYEQDAKKKGISLNYQDASEVFAHCDKEMLKTIVRNLLSNALKFTTEGGAIDINLDKTTIKGIDYMNLRIKDSGIGMTKKVQNSLFNVGVKHLTTGTNGEQGTGLGLILTKEFTEKNKGSIYVESEEGVGSQFTVRIPMFGD
ncbi:MAG: hybrid sensor histidine kinase/response regulator, partial [Bacteroidales bacterium]|nr:hybrid sensor histidine kinase/response regulator [Bacteroidales bacterium]